MSQALQLTQQELVSASKNADNIIQQAYAQFSTGNSKYNTVTALLSNKIVRIIVVIGAAAFALGGISGIALGGADVVLGILLLAIGAAIYFGWRIGVPKLAEYRARPFYEKGNEIINNNSEALSVVPGEYWFPMATEYIARMFATDRADTVREALALTDTYLHRSKMEEAMNATLNSYAAMSQQMTKLQRTASSAAAASWINAVNSYINKL